MIKYFYTFLTISILAVFEFIFFSRSDIFKNINFLDLSLIFFIILFWDYKVSLFASILISFWFSYYSFLPTGVYFVVYLILWVFSWLFSRKITNELSLFSVFGMVLVMIFLKFFIVFLFNWFLNTIGIVDFVIPIDVFSIKKILFELVYNLLFTGLLYFIIKKLSKVLNYSFLKTR